MILHGRLLIDPDRTPEPGWIAVDRGRIEEIGEGEPRSKPDAGDDSCLICPGFIDAHLHLPQIDSVGHDGLDLLDWLDRVIFPAEIRWGDEAHAAAQVGRAYRRLFRAGTLGFAAYLTSHFHGYAATVRAGHQLPLRAIVGQVLMDRNGPPELLGHELTRLARSERGRVECSVNPRFAVSCSDTMLEAACRKAGENAVIQTHLAESKRECETVRRLFPDDADYASVYDRHGLLTPHTLLAHCVHLSEREWDLIAARKSVAVHCPGANVFLRSGLFDLDAARRRGARLALGSDIAAGPDIAMPRVARAMIETAKLRAMTLRPEAHVPTPAEAWRLITRGNADALGWTDAGRIELGAAADLLILRPDLGGLEFDEHLIGRLIYGWRDDFIVQRVLNGRFVSAN